MAKTARRDSGAGSIYESGGRWWCAVTLPSQGGKRRRKVLTGKTRDAVAAKLRDLNRELARTGDLTTSSPTLEKWVRTWLDTTGARTLKPNTLDSYRGSLERYVIPVIGKVRLDKLTPDHVQAVHDYVVTERGLSSTTALQAHRVLAKTLTDALRQGKVSRNVATLVDAPRKALGHRGALTVDEARALLLSVADDPRAAAAWAVALLAGLRQGERLGLTRHAIDLDRTVVNDIGQRVPAPLLVVEWQLQRLRWRHGCRPVGDGWRCGRKRAGSCPDRQVKIPAGMEARQVDGGLWLTRPKSRAGWRQVPLAQPLAEVLARYLETTPPGLADLVFTRADGRPVDPSDDAAAWDAALRHAGLPDVPLHSARHTTATLLHRLGVPDQTRVRILGHSSATVTAGYTHIAGPEMADAMARLGRLIVPELDA